jgi:hypothetical protein
MAKFSAVRIFPCSTAHANDLHFCSECAFHTFADLNGATAPTNWQQYAEAVE